MDFGQNPSEQPHTAATQRRAHHSAAMVRIKACVGNDDAPCIYSTIAPERPANTRLEQCLLCHQTKLQQAVAGGATRANLLKMLRALQGHEDVFNQAMARIQSVCRQEAADALRAAVQAQPVQTLCIGREGEACIFNEASPGTPAQSRAGCQVCDDARLTTAMGVRKLHLSGRCA